MACCFCGQDVILTKSRNGIITNQIRTDLSLLRREMHIAQLRGRRDPRRMWVPPKGVVLLHYAEWVSVGPRGPRYAQQGRDNEAHYLSEATRALQLERERHEVQVKEAF